MRTRELSCELVVTSPIVVSCSYKRPEHNDRNLLAVDGGHERSQTCRYDGDRCARNGGALSRKGKGHAVNGETPTAGNKG